MPTIPVYNPRVQSCFCVTKWKGEFCSAPALGVELLSCQIML